MPSPAEYEEQRLWDQRMAERDRARRRDEAYRAMVDDLVLRGDDVAAALTALMSDDLPETDVEAIEHCNAVVEKWIESRALALARQVEEG